MRSLHIWPHHHNIGVLPISHKVLPLAVWVREALPSPFHTLRTESERLRTRPSKDNAEKLGREREKKREKKGGVEKMSETDCCVGTGFPFISDIRSLVSFTFIFPCSPLLHHSFLPIPA